MRRASPLLMNGEILELSGTRLTKSETPSTAASVTFRSSVFSVIETLRSIFEIPTRLGVDILATVFPPRMPKFRRVEIPYVAEYRDRIARHRDAQSYAPGFWFGRVSRDSAEVKPLRDTTEDVPRSIRFRAA